MKCNCGDFRSFLHVWTHDLDGHVTVQIHLPLLTATLVLQREPGIVVVVWANTVIAAETIIEYANTLNVEDTGNNRRSIFQSSVSRCPKQNRKTIRSET